MSMTKKQEKQLSSQIENTIKNTRFEGLKQGAIGILGVDDTKTFCETSLDMKGMK